MEKPLSNNSIPDSIKYINIETYRRSGDAVQTPVWFVASGGLYYILTRGDSGKVKRLRHNQAVKVAPCRMNGEVTGDWLEAQGSFVESEETLKKIKGLFDEKYGAISRITNLFSRMQRKKMVFIKITPNKL
jgi:PPOX class probable F420-dependent enzyme